MSEHFGDRPIFPPWRPGAAEARERLGVIKKAPDPVHTRLNEIAAEISALEASKANLENERKAILLVVAAYEAIKPAAATRGVGRREGNSVVRILSQANRPLTRNEIVAQLPGLNRSNVSVRLSQLKAKGIVKQPGAKLWEIR